MVSKKHVNILVSDRSELELMFLDRSITVKIHKRVESLLLLDDGLNFAEVIKKVGMSFPTIKQLVGRYNTGRLSCLHDLPRSGRPCRITGEERAKITALACSEVPEGHCKWTLRLLADKVVELGICSQLSHVHAGEILKKTNYSRI